MLTSLDTNDKELVVSGLYITDNEIRGNHDTGYL
jgi:hypothetical protein